MCDLQLSDKLPDKEGYYWWTNFGEHIILCVIKLYDKYLYSFRPKYKTN